MKFRISNIQESPVTLLRRAGYTFQYQESGEMSFVRPLASAGYPRFHMYARVERSDLAISFHLDQKKNTYGDGPERIGSAPVRHHGEYDESGPVKEEADRIKKLLTPEPSSEPEFNI